MSGRPSGGGECCAVLLLMVVVGGFILTAKAVDALHAWATRPAICARCGHVIETTQAKRNGHADR